tara:strand:+ start:23 stop:400 length:378 start_codon:yes stop_codon:yes gene_type:complete
MSTLQVGTIKSSNSEPPVIQNSSGVEKAKISIRSFVNFNAQSSNAIRDSFNVSSIGDNGTGNFTINFSNSMANANYQVYAKANIGNDFSFSGGHNIATGSFTLVTRQTRTSNSADFSETACFVIS